MLFKKNIIINSPPGIIFVEENFLLFGVDVDGIRQTWTPTIAEVQKAEWLLNECARGDYPGVYKKLNQYKRQYVGGSYKEYKKILFIIAFVVEDPDFLRSREIKSRTDNSQEEYFSAAIDMEKEQCLNFRPN